MKLPQLQLNSLASDIFVVIYLGMTLWGRFQLEQQLQGHWLVSLALGAFALLFLWALYKSEYIRPTWFGLLK